MQTRRDSQPTPSPTKPPQQVVFLSPDDPLAQLLARIVTRIMRETPSTENAAHEGRNLCTGEQRSPTR
jgi:hypothetical protein